MLDNDRIELIIEPCATRRYQIKGKRVSNYFTTNKNKSDTSQ